jgi:hypothetical protein
MKWMIRRNGYFWPTMFGKWSPTWEGPYRISRCIPGNAYILDTLEGEEFSKALNGKYLKKYYPSMWVDA